MTAAPSCRVLVPRSGDPHPLRRSSPAPAILTRSGVLAIVRNASVPFGAPYGEFGIYNTEYRTVADATNGRYFLELTTAPNVIWAELDRFDLEEGAASRRLDPDDIALSGDVSDRFEPAEQPY